MDRDLIELIKQLEESHLIPEVRSSPEELAQLLADDFLEFGSSGKKMNKNDCLTGGLTQDKMSLHDFRVHSLGTSSVLTTYRIHNHTKNRHTLRSSIWKFMNGRWRLYFHQGTVTEDIGG